MTTQPEFRVERGPAATDEPFAVGIAKLLEREGRTIAAAELRRIHAENERLHQINQSHEMKLSVRGYEIQIADLEAQRDALLEALRALVRNEGLDAYSYLDKGIGTATAAGQRWLNARAAIKAVEETK